MSCMVWSIEQNHNSLKFNTVCPFNYAEYCIGYVSITMLPAPVPRPCCNYEEYCIRTVSITMLAATVPRPCCNYEEFCIGTVSITILAAPVVVFWVHFSCRVALIDCGLRSRPGSNILEEGKSQNTYSTSKFSST